MRHLISIAQSLTEEIALESETLFEQYQDWLRQNSEVHSVSKREWQGILKSKWHTATTKRRDTDSQQQKRRYVINKHGLLARIREVIDHPTFEYADIDEDA
jgi:hypothetical protein